MLIRDNDRDYTERKAAYRTSDDAAQSIALNTSTPVNKSAKAQHENDFYFNQI